MTLNKQSLEALAAPRALKNDRSSKLVTSANRAKPVNQQYRLIAVIPKSAREQFRIGIRDYNGTPKIEIRLFERDGRGVWQHTPRRMTIGRGPTAAVIAALCECEASP
jgi:hypothetical protein